MNESVPSPSRVRPDSLAETPDRVRPLPTGTDSDSGPSPSPSPDPKCTTCQTYLQHRRTALLPHLGRWIQRTGKPPALIVTKLLQKHHDINCAPRPVQDSTTRVKHAGLNVVQAITVIAPRPPDRLLQHPCSYQGHRWAWLVDGGQACGICGVRR